MNIDYIPFDIVDDARPGQGPDQHEGDNLHFHETHPPYVGHEDGADHGHEEDGHEDHEGDHDTKKSHDSEKQDHHNSGHVRHGKHNHGANSGHEL